MRKILFLFLTFLLTTNLGFCEMKNDNIILNVDEIIQTIKATYFAKPAVNNAPCPTEPIVQKTDRRIEAIEPGVENPETKE